MRMDAQLSRSSTCGHAAAPSWYVTTAPPLPGPSSTPRRWPVAVQADCLPDPGDVFAFLRENGIGQEHALFYVAHATYLEV